MSFIPPKAWRSEYSGDFYQTNILLPALVNRSISYPSIIHAQGEVKVEALQTAARYSFLYQQEVAGHPRFNLPKESQELITLGIKISREVGLTSCIPQALSCDVVIRYLKNHVLKTYDWPEPKY